MSGRSTIRNRWASAVGSVAEEVFAASGSGERPEAPRDDLVLRVHTVAEPCRAKAWHDDAAAFEENAAVAARRVGLAALARGDGPVARRVSEVTASPSGLDSGLESWLRSLGASGRAAVEAAARSWVVDSLARANPGPGTSWSPRNGYWKHAELRFALSASADAVRRDASGGWRLYLTRSAPGSRDAQVARFVALGHALGAGFEADSVRLGFRRTGTTATFAMGVAGLQAAVEELRSILAEALEVAERPAVSGPSCRYCSLRGSCEEGVRALEVFRRGLGG